MIAWRPVVDPIVILIAALALAGLALWSVSRQRTGKRGLRAMVLMLRLTVIASLALLLMGPSRKMPREQPGDAKRVVVLLDTSRSMLLADEGGQSRITRAVASLLAAPWLKHVELWGFDANPHRLTHDDLRHSPETLATGDESRLLDNLAAVDVSGATAFVLISDGRDTTGQPLTRLPDVPVHTASLGSTVLLRDAAVTAAFARDDAFAGDTVELLITLHHAGLEDQDAIVTVSPGDESLTQKARFDALPMHHLTLRWPVTEPGLHEYTVRVSTTAEELRPDNNEVKVFVNVGDRPIRVLLVEGEPSWDTKFLALALRGDERIELTQMTRVTPQRFETLYDPHAEKPSHAPTWGSVNDLTPYDLVILGRGVERVMGEGVALLESYAHGGGHLLMARGAVSSLAPVTRGEQVTEPSTLSLTPAGAAARWLASPMNIDLTAAMRELPATTTNAAGPRPGARVLLETQTGRPALTTMPLGRGSVTTLDAEGLWRWRLLPPRLQRYRGLYDALCSNLVRAIVQGDAFEPGASAALRVERASLRVGQEQFIEVLCKLPPNDVPTLTLHDPDGSSQALMLQPTGDDTRFTASFRPASPGVYRVLIESPEAIERRFYAHEVDAELLNPSADPALMRTIAERTGGVALRLDEMERLADILDTAGIAPENEMGMAYIWDRLPILAVMLIAMGAEWLVRRRSGLA